MSTAERLPARRCFERGDELARYEDVSRGDSEENDRRSPVVRKRGKNDLMMVVRKKLFKFGRKFSLCKRR